MDIIVANAGKPEETTVLEVLGSKNHIYVNQQFVAEDAEKEEIIRKDTYGQVKDERFEEDEEE